MGAVLAKKVMILLRHFNPGAEIIGVGAAGFLLQDRAGQSVIDDLDLGITRDGLDLDLGRAGLDLDPCIALRLIGKDKLISRDGGQRHGGRKNQGGRQKHKTFHFRFLGLRDTKHLTCPPDPSLAGSAKFRSGIGTTRSGGTLTVAAGTVLVGDEDQRPASQGGCAGTPLVCLGLGSFRSRVALLR